MVVGGFGWSAGDIATAIKLVVKLSKAFKASGGAAARYEEALGFLCSLKTTLDHLAEHAHSTGQNSFGQDVAEQLRRITPHWNQFEEFLRKYDASLSSDSSLSRFAKAPRTLQFALKDLSGEVDKLRTAIAQPLQVVNTLLSLQIVHETRLVPQKLLTASQCQQLVEAISLAGIPVALSDRLDHLQKAHDTSFRSLEYMVLGQVSNSTEPTPSTYQREQDLSNSQPAIAASTRSSRFHGTACATKLDHSPDVAQDLRAFRILVEDQHWGVIQLLRALSEQLDELKRRPLAYRSDVMICDEHSRAAERQRGWMSPTVNSNAIMLLTCMTASVTTGIVVGKTVAAVSTSSMNASKITPSSTRVVSQEAGPSARQPPNTAKTRDNASVSAGDKRSEPVQQVSPTEKAATGLRDQTSTKTKNPQVHEAMPRDSVHMPDEETSNDATQSASVVATVSKAPTLCPAADISTNRSSTAPAVAGVLSTNPSNAARIPESGAIDAKDFPAFFKLGRVFMTLWSAASEEAVHRSGELAEVPYIDRQSCLKVTAAELRRFVVLRNEGPYSLCAPILLGITLNEVKYLQTGPYEIPITMADWIDKPDDATADLALTVVPSNKTSVAKVPKYSRVKLKEVCMIEHGIDLVDIGCIADEDLSLLEQLWRDGARDTLRPWLVEDAALYGEE